MHTFFSQQSIGGFNRQRPRKKIGRNLVRMAPPSSAPIVFVEPEYCPQAVADWYECTGGSQVYNYNHGRKDLCTKAKKHLSALGWTFWYTNKKGRLELRYQSPQNGKTYISLKTACKRCIQDGGTVQQPSSTTPISSSSEETHATYTVATTTTITTTLMQQTRKYKKPRVQPTRCNRRYTKKRKRESSESDDEWSQEELKGSNKRGSRVLRSSKRVKHESCSDYPLRKPRTIISWLIDHKVVVLEAKVFCCGGNNNGVKTGRLLRSGIACACCGFIFSATRFEAHAGCTKHRPSANIFLEDGRSLEDCLREALNSQHHDFMMQGSYNTNYQLQSDSICSVCHYGGDLMLCDQCPSAFHHTCLGLEKVPDGDWFCPSCCCKICNLPRYREDCVADHDVDNSVLVCDQCEGKYHIGCLKNKGFAKLKTYADENWFCNSACENIFFSLQKLIGKPIALGADNLTCTFLKKTMKSDHNCGGHNSDDLEGLSQIESKLSVALGVMHECFEPMIDAFSGRDIVADVIFSRGSEHNRLNFKGFYTVILERNDEVISVATIRIFGQRVAEVPLVATRRQFRRQGMCRILMHELENRMTRFGVERMILPAAHEVVGTWTNSFGFARMTYADKYQFQDYTFLDFQDSTVCHKVLKKT